MLLGGLIANAVLWSAGRLPFEQTRKASLLVLTLCVVGGGATLGLSRLRRWAGRPGRSVGGVAGALSAAAGLGLLALLVFRPEPVPGATPVILSWVALGLALIDQLASRRDYFARYERVGTA